MLSVPTKDKNNPESGNDISTVFRCMNLKMHSTHSLPIACQLFGVLKQEIIISEYIILHSLQISSGILFFP